MAEISGRNCYNDCRLCSGGRRTAPGDWIGSARQGYVQLSADVRTSGIPICGVDGGSGTAAAIHHASDGADCGLCVWSGSGGRNPGGNPAVPVRFACPQKRKPVSVCGVGIPVRDWVKNLAAKSPGCQTWAHQRSRFSDFLFGRVQSSAAGFHARIPDYQETGWLAHVPGDSCSVRGGLSGGRRRSNRGRKPCQSGGSGKGRAGRLWNGSRTAAICGGVSAAFSDRRKTGNETDSDRVKRPGIVNIQRFSWTGLPAAAGCAVSRGSKAFSVRAAGSGV